MPLNLVLLPKGGLGVTIKNNETFPITAGALNITDYD
jgi:hypothetical protein